LLPHLRQQVHFRNANLTDPGFLRDEPPYDLIICRNVFIYFTADGRRRAMASLDRLLSLDGMLCLTTGEADRLPPGQFMLAAPGEFGLYRRVVSAVTPTMPPLFVPPPTPLGVPRVSLPSSPLPPLPPIPVPASNIPTTAPAIVPANRGSGLQAAREHANAGRLVEARTACERSIREAGGATADAYTLLGTIHLAEGHSDEAADAFRRALYLDPDHAEAISHMIVICDRKGNATQAAALRRRLLRQPREDAK
jgi:chemotaxis protein methyltransferase WspC